MVHVVWRASLVELISRTAVTHTSPNMLSIMRLSIVAATVLVLFVALTRGESNHDILLHGKTAIQLKLFDNAFHFYRNPLKSFSYHVMWQNETSQWSTQNVLVSRLVPDHSHFVAQTQEGLEYNGAEMVTFYLNTTTPLTTSLSVVVSGEKQYKLRAFIEPFKQLETSGYRNVTLIDEQWNVVGEVKILYLVIRPITMFDPLAEQYSNTDDAVFMGHRGTGVQRRMDLPEQFLENTIAAFNYACSKGADMIELDVQLSSDKVPIIYHDFFVRTFLHDRVNDTQNISFTIPIKDIPFSDYKKISTNFIPHDRPQIDTIENQSFETLEDVLKLVNPKCGINVEIKYPQIFENLEWDGAVGVELNEYVDRIFAVLYKFGGDRKMVITSFHPDLCTLVQLKQNKYRVALLTSGATKKWDPKALYIYDPRATTIELGSAYATSMNLKGLSLLTQDVLAETGDPKHIDYIRSRNLTLYLWGDRLNSYDRLMQLKKAGVNALIFDKLDLLLANHHA